MMEFLSKPWPWYIAGPLIGLTVPALLLMGNKHFGISATLRHICAACVPAKIPFFQYNWKHEMWNLFFVAGILIGGFIAVQFFANPEPVQLHPKLVADLASYSITDMQHPVPADLFNWPALLTPRGFILMVIGGFMVGFGTRYAGGCTSGHAIMGLSNLQWPSLIATCCFMAGGFIMTHLLMPFILAL
ncbi:MAG TPA: YeeE/YedE thiosulfate transporter family protein [Phnomibacter sp.]|nr:YeeE/YedE thiosulfate transporter family protein [Phnomibacter sp.]